MSGYFKAGKIKEEKMQKHSKETVSEINKYPFLEYKERGISKKTCEKYGVRAAVSEKDGKTIEAFYFPSYNQKGVVVGYMKQDITVSKYEDWHWQAIGSVTVHNKMFGQDVAEANSRKRNNVVITEGQWDALSAYQSLVDNVKGTSYEGLQPFVVSIPLGTANAVESILHNNDFIKSFQGLTLFFDNDECTPSEAKKGHMKGRETTEAVAATLVNSGIDLFVVEAENGFKDASDYLQANQSAQLAKLVQFGKKPYVPEKIIKASDISLDDLCLDAPSGVMVTEFPKLMEKTWGIQRRVVTLVAAPSGVGKTTAVSIIENSIGVSGHKTGLIFLEETTKETLQRKIAFDLKVNFLKFKRSPLSMATREAIEASREKIIKTHHDPSFLDHFGSIAANKLMAKIKYMHEIDKCSYIILDHISMTISGLDVVDERKDLDVVMTELAAYASSHDVGIIVVCHLNRSGTAEQAKVKKGDEDKPFWIRVTKESLRGSAGLEQLSMVILGLEPEILPNRQRGWVRWVVLKNRPAGELGEADIFKLDPVTWKVILRESDFND